MSLTIDWDLVDTVLLDMDGTLLDRHFDDHFWLEHVPKRYAQKHAISLDCAKERLYRLFRSQENTLNWTDLDYWSDQLGLDIPVLKEEVDHLIAVHPFVIEFLLFLRRHRKGIYLVTNAHDLGLPKEEPAFWGKVQEKTPFNPERTMLGEDSETNLETARLFGIRYLIHVGRFSSQATPAASRSFTTIDFFSALLPSDGTLTVTI